MDDLIATALKRFDHCSSAESENRELALADLEFEQGDQWPEDVKEKRKDAPCLTVNKIPSFVRQIVNDIRQIRPSIKVRGVDSQSDPATAKIINGMIRAIEADSSAESAYDWAAEKAVKMGFGYWRITTEYESENSFDQILKIKRIRNSFSVYVDPAAQEQDASDARYMFIVDKMSKDAFDAKYPDGEGSWEGGEKDSFWFGEDYVRIAEYWVKEEETYPISLVMLPDGTQGIAEGKIDGAIATRDATRTIVKQYLITGQSILEETDWLGKYIPIVRVLGREEDIEGEVKLKGTVRDLKDAQRQYNYSRSAETERIALASKGPWVGPKGAFKNQKWTTANKSNHAYLEYEVIPGQPPPWRDAPPEASSALMNAVQVSSEELKSITGIYDPGLGARSNEVSGVAINGRQTRSDISNFDFVDNLSRAMTYAGKVLVDLIPKIYGGERMMRILNQDGTDEMVTLNAPYIDQKTMQPRMYDLNAGRYDVSVDIGPAYATQRAEASDSMMEMLKALPQAAPLIGDLIAKNQDWPGSEEIAERLQMMLPPEVLAGENPQFKMAMQQAQQQQQMLQGQLQQAQQIIQQMQVELRNKQGEMTVKEGELANKIQKTINDHIEGMTKLELEAGRDLNQAGVAY